ncbi:type II toxin-antitoxin system PemK/MazF family toxin [Enterococcus sp. BWB1-3]|uniref:type II toxin-antitoxin system PemK/MazF family toxin n=1 Tax=unclassified Enterococcus TaxID=2608891 RepID=UPI0019207558|nr:MULTISPECIES: type II toxin-antitoxin system PemK/MazF family toxin [unclassified Enterococcus]MBL1227698.1 type II toxin-antitoxin system PemK/MazF family toxin [Enterococcus sp. BWB1-3]MCB5954478.1 type II toxin-antitoxin system PemK/MazF family toxin [Enterococcus sp. CWB-B31]
MVKRGDIYFADLSPVVGSEQGGIRPVLVIQNNLGNHFSPTIIVAAVTAKMAKPKLPTHIGINSEETGIERDSVILLEQIRTIDKARLKEKVCHLNSQLMSAVDRALGISVGIIESEPEESVGTYQI